MSSADHRARPSPESGIQSGRHHRQHHHRRSHQHRENPLKLKQIQEHVHRSHGRRNEEEEEKLVATTGLLEKLSLIFGANRSRSQEALIGGLSSVKLEHKQELKHKHKHKYKHKHRHGHGQRSLHHMYTHSNITETRKESDALVEIGNDNKISEGQQINLDTINEKELKDKSEIHTDSEAEQKKESVDDILDQKNMAQSQAISNNNIFNENTSKEDIAVYSEKNKDISDGYESDTESDSSELNVVNESAVEIARGWHRLVSMRSSEVNKVLDHIKLQNQSTLDNIDSSLESVASSSEHDDVEEDMTSIEYNPTEIARGWHRLVSQDSEIYELTFEPVAKAEMPLRRTSMSDTDVESVDENEAFSDLSDYDEKIEGNQNLGSAFFKPIQDNDAASESLTHPGTYKDKHECETLSKTKKPLVDQSTVKHGIDTPVVDDEIKELAGEVKKDVDDIKNSFEKLLRFFIPPVALIPITLVFVSIIGALKLANQVTIAGIRGIIFILPKIYNGIVRFHKRQFRGLLKLIIYWYVSLSKVMHLTTRGTGLSILWIFRTTKRGHRALVRYMTTFFIFVARSIQRSAQTIWYMVTENAFKPLLATLHTIKKLVTMPFWGGRYFVRATLRLIKNARDNREEFIDLAVAIIGLLIIALIATGRLFPFIYDFVTGQSGVHVDYYVIELPSFQIFGRTKPSLLSRLSLGLL